MGANIRIRTLIKVPLNLTFWSDSGLQKLGFLPARPVTILTMMNFLMINLFDNQLCYLILF